MALGVEITLYLSVEMPSFAGAVLSSAGMWTFTAHADRDFGTWTLLLESKSKVISCIKHAVHFS